MKYKKRLLNLEARIKQWESSKDMQATGKRPGSKKK